MRLTPLSISLAAVVVICAFVAPTHHRPEIMNVALTPPMGWNSWDSYGAAVREENVRANADYMAAHLAKYGWQYIVVDIQWYEPHAQGHDYHQGAVLTMDRYGRLTPAENRFPSATNGAGFKPLADYVHSKGLKFGIHILRGVPRQAVEQNTPIEKSNHRAADIADKQNICRWNTDMYGVDMSKPGAQDYYDSLVALYASWGVDFIKADDMSSPYHADEIAALHDAIDYAGRPIVLSLSPGPAPLDRVSDLQANAQMWRISDDFWDDWKLLRRQFDLVRDWATQIGKNNTWPDADMLPLGTLRITDKDGPSKTHFTLDEQHTVMNLWCIARSPLMFGGDLPSLDHSTLLLLTNWFAMNIDQFSTENRQVLDRGDIRIWKARLSTTNQYYLAVFNLGETDQTLDLNLDEFDVGIGPFFPLEIWNGRDFGQPSSHLRIHLRPHASTMYVIPTTRAPLGGPGGPHSSGGGM